MAGRPKELQDRVTVTISTEREEWERFGKNCRRENSDASSEVTEFVKQYNKLHGEGNPQPTIEKFVEDPNYRAFPTISMPTEGKDPAAFTDAELEEIMKGGTGWRTWALHALNKRNALQKTEHRKIKEEDIAWLMIKGKTRQEAVAHLKTQGFEEK